MWQHYACSQENRSTGTFGRAKITLSTPSRCHPGRMLPWATLRSCVPNVVGIMSPVIRLIHPFAGVCEHISDDSAGIYRKVSTGKGRKVA